MIFRQTTQADLDFVRANPFEDAVRKYPVYAVPDENCYTAIFEGEIVGVGGIQMKWDGVGELWLILTKGSRKHGIFGLIALATLEKKINELIEKNNVWRAQAIIRPDFPLAIKMIEAFGFKNETPDGMQGYLPDKSTAYLYAKVI